MTATVHSIVGLPRPLALDRAYIAGRLSDDSVAKVLSVSEVAQIARTERRLREYLEAQWNMLAKEAAGAASLMAARGKSAASIAARVDTIMIRWAHNVEGVFSAELERIYKLGRKAAYKKAATRSKASLQYDTPNFTEETAVKKAKKEVKAEPKMDLADAGSIKALKQQQLLWIGEHYEKNVSQGIASVTRAVIVEAGGDRAKAGKAMAAKVADELAHVRTPDGFHGSAKQYFEGLVANAATVARAHSQMRSFLDIGISAYVIVNPLDERTCPICRHMDGKVFKIEDGAKQMRAELRAKTPGAVRGAHPWMGKGITKLTTAGALAGAGQALPPFHFRCRCTVDITEEAGSYEDMEPMTPPTVEEDAAPKEPAASAEASARADAFNQLTDATLKSTRRLGGGVNTSEIATMELPDGQEVKGVWKMAKGEEKRLRDNIVAGTYYRREAATAELDTMLGDGAVVPATVTRRIDGEHGSLQMFDPAAEKYNGATAVGKAVDAISKTGSENNESMRRTFLVDAISGNDDRHGGNIMFKLLGKEKKLTAVAIDNGLTFPEGGACRFLFPSARSTEKSLQSFLKLDDKSVEQLARLDLAAVAKMLEKNGISKAGARPALVRIATLQNDRDFLFKLRNGKVKGYFPASADRAMVRFIEMSATEPESLLKDLSAVDSAMKAAYK